MKIWIIIYPFMPQPQICRTKLFINTIKCWICNFSKEMKRPSVLLIKGLGEREWKYDWKKSLFSFCNSLHTVGQACINFIRTDGSYTGTSTRALAHTNMFTKHRHGERERERERETCKCDEWANASMLCKCLYTLVSIHVKEQASFYKMLNLFFTCKKLSVHKLQLIHDLFFYDETWYYFISTEILI